MQKTLKQNRTNKSLAQIRFLNFNNDNLNTHECVLENIGSISKFTQEFVASEECVKTNLKHFKLLELKREKRKKMTRKASTAYQICAWL